MKKHGDVCRNENLFATQTKTRDSMYPPCFDICPLAKELYDLAERMGQTSDSRAAFDAYSKLFCLESQLKRGECVKNWAAIANDAGEKSVQAWRRYTSNPDFYMKHNDIMSIHGRSIAALVSAMGTCVP